MFDCTLRKQKKITVKGTKYNIKIKEKIVKSTPNSKKRRRNRRKKTVYLNRKMYKKDYFHSKQTNSLKLFQSAEKF